MKRTLFVGLSALALSLTAAPAFAGETVALNRDSQSNIQQITPTNLVTRSYQGSFTNQGIPSYGVFVKEANSGRVTAEDLVEVGIASGRLAPETINDRDYLSSVDFQLRNFNND